MKLFYSSVLVLTAALCYLAGPMRAIAQTESKPVVTCTIALANPPTRTQVARGPDLSEACFETFVNGSEAQRMRMLDWQNANLTDIVTPLDLKTLSLEISDALAEKLAAQILFEQQRTTYKVPIADIDTQIAVALSRDDTPAAGALMLAGIAGAMELGNAELVTAFNDRIDSLPLIDSYPVLKGTSDLYRGIIFSQRQDTLNALNTYLPVLDMAEAIGDEKLIVQSGGVIGTLFYTLDEYEEALKYFKEGVKYKENQTDDRGRRILAYEYGRVGIIYFNMEDYNSALDWLDRAITLSEDVGNPVLMKGVRIHRAKTLFAMERSEEALVEIRKAMEEAKTYRSEREVVEAHLVAAELGVGREDFNAAQTDLAVAKAFYQPGGISLEEATDPDVMSEGQLLFIEYMNLMGKVLSAVGNHEEAMPYAQMSFKLMRQQDEFRSKEVLKNAELLFVLRNQGKDLQIAQQSQAISDVKIQRSRLVAVFSFLGLLGAGVIALFYRQSSRAQRELAGVKDMFLREMNHRTSNSFQLIMSLLRSDLRVSPSNRLQSALSRVTAIGISHKFLSVDSDQGQLDAKAYLDRLLDVHEESLLPDEVEVVRELTPYTATAETLMPLGLLVTEALMNTTKHAFPNGKGRIEIVSRVELDGTASLSIRDDGIGFQKQRTDREGVQLIEDLAYQIDCTAELRTEVDQGTTWTIKGIQLQEAGLPH